MRALLLILTFCSFCTATVNAQTTEDSVKQVITSFFDGMRRTDTSMMRATLSPSAILQTIARNRQGQTFIRSEVMDSMILSVGRPRKEILDERIRFETIKIDADLAIVWTPYQFYIDEKFSHCGVNSFQMVRLGGQWKIQYIIDTRRRGDCLPIDK